MPLLIETNPKKSKYGFKCTNRNHLLDVGVLVRGTIGSPVAPVVPPFHGDSDLWWEEVIANMGTVKYLIYLNDEDLYKRLVAANALT